MEYSIEDFNISEQTIKLGIEYPNGFCFIPENLDSAKDKSNFIYTDSISDLKKFFKQNEIQISLLEGEQSLLRSRKNADIFLPTLFFGYSLLISNPTIVTIALNILSSYVYDRFKGTFGTKTVIVDLIIEIDEKKKTKRISYKGNVDGIVKLADVIKSLK